jgi:hypothetical protein
MRRSKKQKAEEREGRIKALESWNAAYDKAIEHGGDACQALTEADACLIPKPANFPKRSKKGCDTCADTRYSSSWDTGSYCRACHSQHHNHADKHLYGATGALNEAQTAVLLTALSADPTTQDEQPQSKLPRPRGRLSGLAERSCASSGVAGA